MGAALSEPNQKQTFGPCENYGAGTGFLLPEHFFRSSQPLIPMGDPTNLRNQVYDSDFSSVGKPWGYSWKHTNLYTNIRGINAIQERFFGRVIRKVRYRMPRRNIAGEQATFKVNANLERPASVPYGDFATYVADGSERIGGRTGWR